MKKVVVVSGGFDPIHSGHIFLLNEAKKLGDILIVALNDDQWLQNKKGKEFLNFSERKNILENLRMVDGVIGFENDNSGSCIEALKKLKRDYPNDEIIFCNGGDRNGDNIPEMAVEGITFEFGVGGDNKSNSSSWILKDWKYEKAERLWGEYFNLFDDKNTKVKELIVHPGKGMSYQRHFKRSEIWLVSSGKCNVNFSKDDTEKYETKVLKKFDYFHVPVTSWHQIFNPYEEECRIIEIQYGEANVEDDIERVRYFEDTKK